MLTPTSLFCLAEFSSRRSVPKTKRSLLPMSLYFFRSTSELSLAPPPKRRRLGETIITTAINAALIGTAVGLTAYRL